MWWGEEKDLEMVSREGKSRRELWIGMGYRVLLVDDVFSKCTPRRIQYKNTYINK